MSGAKGKASVFDVELGRRVRLARSLCACTQSELAEQIGVTFQQLQKYENGMNRITAQRLVCIADVLRVSCGDLIAPGARSIPNSDDPLLPELLRCWSRIKSPGARQAILRFIRSVSKAEAPDTACRKKAGQKRTIPAGKIAESQRA